MTHEDFKNIASFCYNYSKEYVNEFLDGENNDSTLDTWFKLWQKGDNRPIFDEIKTINETWRVQRKNTTTKVKPKDYNMKRERKNKNVIR